MFDKLNKKQYDKQYYLKNKKRIVIRNKKYIQRNIDKIQKSRKKYYQKNKDTINQQRKEYRKTNFYKENYKKYFLKYYRKNNKKIIRRNKKYAKKNKERIKLYRQEYNKQHKERTNLRQREWYALNKEKNHERFLLRNRKYRKENKDRLNKQNNIRRMNVLKSWEGYIPSETNCQICGKKIYFNKNDRKNAIHFDHKNEDVLIKGNPTEWLAHNLRIPEKQKIWEACDFGELCGCCNRVLPTKNRKKFIVNVTKYIFPAGKNI